MIINGENRRSLWFEDETLFLIDQRKLPSAIEIFEAHNEQDTYYAIKEMVVRGAPAIGCAAAYGIALSKDPLEAGKLLRTSRPTAYDLFYAIDKMIESFDNDEDLVLTAHNYTELIIEKCKKIGENGASLLSQNTKILTHCNAGALATVDYGTALAPIRIAKHKNPFVWVDETRPRLQGLLTAWELEQEGIDCCIIADNSSGHFIKNGDVDIVIVGADRIASNYDIANKIGTYEKAVVAYENNVPFYVAAPLSTFDMEIKDGKDIIVEERQIDELNNIYCYRPKKARNPAFDVTPNKYITGIITEDGIINVNVS